MSSNGLSGKSHRLTTINNTWRNHRPWPGCRPIHPPCPSHSPVPVNGPSPSLANQPPHRSGTSASAIPVKREDCQPGEDTCLPYRLRRPVQPPLIRTTSTKPTKHTLTPDSSSSRVSQIGSRRLSRPALNPPCVISEPSRGEELYHGRGQNESSLDFRNSSTVFDDDHNPCPLIAPLPDTSISSSKLPPTNHQTRAGFTPPPPRSSPIQPQNFHRSSFGRLSEEQVTRPAVRANVVQCSQYSQVNQQERLRKSGAFGKKRRFVAAPDVDAAHAGGGLPRKRPKSNPKAGRQSFRDDAPGRICRKVSQASSHASSPSRSAQSNTAIAVTASVELNRHVIMKDFVNLTRLLLSSFGPINIVSHNQINGADSIAFNATVLFQHARDAHRATSKKKLPVPNGFGSQGCMMLIKLDRKYKPPLVDTKSKRDRPNSAQTSYTPSGSRDDSNGSDHSKMPAADAHLTAANPSGTVVPVAKQDIACSKSICAALPPPDCDNRILVETDEDAQTSTMPDIDGMNISRDSDIEIITVTTIEASPPQRETSKGRDRYEAEGMDSDAIETSGSGCRGDTMERFAVEAVVCDLTEPGQSSVYDAQAPSILTRADHSQVLQRRPGETSRKIMQSPKLIRSMDLLDDQVTEEKDSGIPEAVIASNPETIDLINDASEPGSRSPLDLLSLPVHDLLFALPLECQEKDVAYIKNRFHFKLEKIRAATQSKRIVLNSSWTDDHLILHTIDDSESANGPLETSAVLPDAALSLKESAEPTSHSWQSSVASVIPIYDAQPSPDRSSHHFIWPLAPKTAFIDKIQHPDLQRTLEDFLSTFFRLWEQSRVGLKSLYDRSAVFSNLLAKQGCKPSKVTKSIGWQKISHSIARLPALSNDPFEDLIVDASAISTDPPIVLCTVHGAFSEFPKNIKRAFDRSFVLRPVDNSLSPFEGCMGVIKWIILSDTLTVRRHTAQTAALISCFKQPCALEADRLPPAGRETDVGAGARCDPYRRDRSVEVLRQFTARQSSHEFNSIPSYSVVDLRSASPELDTADSPPAIRDAEYAPEAHHGTHSLAAISYLEPIPQAVNITPAGHIAELAAQVREMRTELNKLRRTPQTETRSCLLRTAVTPQEVQLVNPFPMTSSSLNDVFKISKSFACPHRGFGVTKKRYLVPTELDVYLNISLRGDVVTWARRDRSKVELLLSGSSPTDKVEAACYSDAHQTLIVGSCASSAVRSATTPQVALIKLNQTDTGLTCHRTLLSQIVHEHGVRATCLFPQVRSTEGGDLRFVTAGHQEKKMFLWKVVNGVAEVTKRFTEHPSGIQALEFSGRYESIFSGDSGGRVFQTHLESNASSLLLGYGDRASIYWVQADPLQPHTVMVTSATKEPEQQFRLCDVRGEQAVLSFGFGRNQREQGYGPPVETYRKGSLWDNYFAYPTGELGGTMIWDLRSTRTHLVKVGTGIASQIHFESRRTMVMLEKEMLRYIDFQ